VTGDLQEAKVSEAIFITADDRIINKVSFNETDY